MKYTMHAPLPRTTGLKKFPFGGHMQRSTDSGGNMFVGYCQAPDSPVQLIPEKESNLRP